MLNRRIMTFTLIGASVFFGLYYAIAPKYLMQTQSLINATVFKPNKPLADFSLKDTNEQPFTKQSLKGHWTLILFGYMHCPDICPKNLTALAQTWRLFAQEKRYPVNFVFASIDPQMPIAKDLHDYLFNYNSKFVGIFGPIDKMHELTTQLGIYAKREGKVIDHSTSLILIDPQGRLKAVITPPFEPTALAHDLKVLTQ